MVGSAQMLAICIGGQRKNPVDPAPGLEPGARSQAFQGCSSPVYTALSWKPEDICRLLHDRVTYPKSHDWACSEEEGLPSLGRSYCSS